SDLKVISIGALGIGTGFRSAASADAVEAKASSRKATKIVSFLIIMSSPRTCATDSGLRLLRHRYSWGLPASVQNRRRCCRRPVQAHHQGEFPFWCRQPVGLFCLTWRICLQIHVHRIVLICDEVVALAQAVPVNRVRHEKKVRIVHSQRPETLDRGKLTLV